jgi:hypothetical protein
MPTTPLRGQLVIAAAKSNDKHVIVEYEPRLSEIIKAIA